MELRMRLQLLVGIVCVLAVAGCGNSKSPAAPSSRGSLGIFVDGDADSFTSIGQHIQLRVAYLGSGEDVTSKATYTSSHPDVATVTAKGLVTSVGRGGTTITVAHEGTTAQAPFLVYLVADFRGTWTVGFDILSGPYGTMTWHVSSSTTSVSGSITNVTPGGDRIGVLFPLDTSGALSGTVSGHYDSQLFSWHVALSPTAECPEGGAMSGNVHNIIGTQSLTTYDGDILSATFCGIGRQGGSIRMTKQ
jgi:hypothetical protein